MSQEVDMFKNVNVIKRANIYFDGKISSRTIFLPTGERKTLGIILPGHYKIQTKEKEIVEVLDGSAKFKLPNKEEWIKVKKGEIVEIPSNSTFEIVVEENDKFLDYVCSYIQENKKV